VGLFLLRGGTLHGRWRALGKGEHTTLLSFSRGGGALEKGVHHYLEGGTLERRALHQRQRKGKGKVKGTSKGKVKAKAQGKGSKAR
jgi:hypothetical protein